MISSSIDALSVCMHGHPRHSENKQQDGSVLATTKPKAKRKEQKGGWKWTAEKKALKLVSSPSSEAAPRATWAGILGGEKAMRCPSSPRARSPREHGAGQVGQRAGKCAPHARPPPATPPPDYSYSSPGGHGVGWTLVKLRAVFHCLIPRLPRHKLATSDWGNLYYQHRSSPNNQNPRPPLQSLLSLGFSNIIVYAIDLTLLALGTSSCSAFILSAILSLRSCKTATVTGRI